MGQTYTRVRGSHPPTPGCGPKGRDLHPPATRSGPPPWARRGRALHDITTVATTAPGRAGRCPARTMVHTRFPQPVKASQEGRGGDTQRGKLKLSGSQWLLKASRPTQRGTPRSISVAEGYPEGNTLSIPPPAYTSPKEKGPTPFASQPHCNLPATCGGSLDPQKAMHWPSPSRDFVGPDEELERSGKGTEATAQRGPRPTPAAHYPTSCPRTSGPHSSP